MKGQAAAGGGKEAPKGKKPEAKKLELAEKSAEPIKKKKPVLGSQKKVCLYSIVGKQFAELYNYTISVYVHVHVRTVTVTTVCVC